MDCTIHVVYEYEQQFRLNCLAKNGTDFVSICLNNDLYVEAIPNVPTLYSDIQQGQLHSPSDINGKSKPLSYVVFMNTVYMYKQTILTH